MSVEQDGLTHQWNNNTLMTEPKKDTSEDREVSDVNWGFIMAMTGAYLLLVEQLASQNVVNKKALIEGLNSLRGDLRDLPHAKFWLTTTIKQLSENETQDGPDQDQ